MEWDAKIPSPWDWPPPAPPRPQSETSSIGLKLGKRTYFEDAGSGGVGGDGAQSPSPAPLKKSKTAPQLLAAPNSRCQVEGCNADLTAAKDYHRKHRVCGHHSKSPKVIVAGQERRFCQQCSRFHELAEFDQKKRSCRRRLSDHNARRRKPQPDALSFNPSRAPLSFYEDRQQLNFPWNRVPFGQLRSTTNSTWEGLSDFKLTQTNGSWMKSEKIGTFGRQIHLPSTGISTNASNDLDRLLPFKGSTAEVLNQGLEASAVASNLDGAPDFRRALSLLSIDSWGSATPDLRPASLVNFSTKSHDGVPQSAVHPGSTNLEYWQEEQPLPQQAHSLSFNLHSNGSQFQQFQVLKAPFEASLFDSSQIH